MEKEQEKTQETTQGKVFANCRKCTKPYVKTAKFPNEDCPACKDTL